MLFQPRLTATTPGTNTSLKNCACVCFCCLLKSPESIGLARGESESGAGIMLGKHSGRNAVSTRLAELGYEFDAEKLNAIFTRFKVVAEKKKGGLEDDDLEALVSDTAFTMDENWALSNLQVTTGMSGIPTATVTMIGPDGVARYTSATGEGPVDATYKAIDKIVGLKVSLETYGMQSVTEGIDALAKTRITISPLPESSLVSTAIHSQSGKDRVRTFSGAGSDGDVVVASARAYVSALNKVICWNRQRQILDAERKAKAGDESAEAPAPSAQSVPDEAVKALRD